MHDHYRSRGWRALSAGIASIALVACVTDEGSDDVTYAETQSALTSTYSMPAAPANAIAVPADYDGDGYTDFALKGANGVWYIDMAKCYPGTTEPTRCSLNADGFGRQWDFALTGYGDASAIPVPADYDGDGRADLATKDSTGRWAIDYAFNGFGYWDWFGTGYGCCGVPVPADYDGDHKADVAIRETNGRWWIDLAADGFGTWNTPGGILIPSENTAAAVPVPGDYNGDGCADLAVKDPSTTSGGVGVWHIDLATQCGAPYAVSGFGSWQNHYYGYGNASAIPVPADYEGDGKIDLAVKDASGTWYMDNSNNGFGGWDNIIGGFTGSSKAIPGRYDTSRGPNAAVVDLATEDSSGSLRMKLWAGSWSGFSTIPGTSVTGIANPSRELVNAAGPWIDWMRVYLPIGPTDPIPREPVIGSDLSAQAKLVNGQYQLVIGVRYTVAVRIKQVGPTRVTVERNPDLKMPTEGASPGLMLTDSQGMSATSSLEASTPEPNATRQFAVTCTQPGQFRLGYLLRAQNQSLIQMDYGVRVACVTQSGPLFGLYGRVNTRSRDVHHRYIANAGVYQATVRIQGPGVDQTYLTDGNGDWIAPVTAPGPYTITVTKPGRSPVKAIAVKVPAGSGTRVDVAMENITQLGNGLTYTQYLDYSKGRTLFHVVEVDTTRSTVKLHETDYYGASRTQLTDRKTLVQNATARGLPVAMNLSYWTGDAGNSACNPWVSIANAVGYFQGMRTGAMSPTVAPGFRPSVRFNCAPQSLPMLAIAGRATGQSITIENTDSDFLNTLSPHWTTRNGSPAYEVRPIDFAMQTDTPIMFDGASTVTPLDAGSKQWARTSVGTDADRNLAWLVVADGEGINGGHGASFPQLFDFYAALGARRAIGHDGGSSSNLTLRDDTGVRRNVNMFTLEQQLADFLPDREGEILETIVGPGGSNDSTRGRYFNYVSAGW